MGCSASRVCGAGAPSKYGPLPDVEGPADDVEEEVLAQRRAVVVAELLETERSFVKHLSTVRDMYCAPLRLLAGPTKEEEEAAKQQAEADGTAPSGLLARLRSKSVSRDIKIPRSQLEDIFNGVEDVLALHVTVLKELEEVGEDADAACDVLIRHAGEMRGVYTPFVIGYPRAARLVSSWSESDPNFAKFLLTARGDPRAGGLGLMSFLIMPVQRLPRYSLLIAELRKATRMTLWAPHRSITRAAELMHDAASHVNERMRSHLNLTRILEIQHTMRGSRGKGIVLLTPGREVVRDEVISIKSSISRAPGEFKEQAALVFSDAFMWMSAGGKDLFKGIIPFEMCKVDDESPTDGHVNCLSLTGLEQATGKHVELALSFKTEAEAAEWRKALEKNIARAKEDAKSKAEKAGSAEKAEKAEPTEPAEEEKGE